jgi:hypothetical protein
VYGLEGTKSMIGVTGGRTTLFHAPANVSQTLQLCGTRCVDLQRAEL